MGFKIECEASRSGVGPEGAVWVGEIRTYRDGFLETLMPIETASAEDVRLTFQTLLSDWDVR